MIILSDLRGQLCNRIFLTGYGMALAEGTGQTLVDFSLNEYAGCFPATRRKKWLELPYKLLRGIVRAFVKIVWRIPMARELIIDVTYSNSGETSTANPAFMARIKRRPITFIRMDSYFDLSKIVFPPTETIRRHFTPDPEVLSTVREHARHAKGDADVLIGVHIRRGDYDVHLGGRHYFPAEFYREAMDRVAALFPNRRVAFLLCSNEKQSLELFAPLRVTPGPGTLLGDLYCLAECDYLLGPPSTYSLWAAYYARKPVCQMFRREAPSSLDQFVVPDGHFECYDLKTV